MKPSVAESSPGPGKRDKLTATWSVSAGVLGRGFGDEHA